MSHSGPSSIQKAFTGTFWICGNLDCKYGIVTPDPGGITRLYCPGTRGRRVCDGFYHNERTYLLQIPEDVIYDRPRLASYFKDKNKLIAIDKKRVCYGRNKVILMFPGCTDKSPVPGPVVPSTTAADPAKTSGQTLPGIGMAIRRLQLLEPDMGQAPEPRWKGNPVHLSEYQTRRPSGHQPESSNPAC
ncbi:MAG: hypothetical protein MMC23_003503 [Stictis urceolatum]|nr:hypothetical protein [Stictis urceolata]